jgi:hypothetical protein
MIIAYHWYMVYLTIYARVYSAWIVIVYSMDGTEHAFAIVRITEIISASIIIIANDALFPATCLDVASIIHTLVVSFTINISMGAFTSMLLAPIKGARVLISAVESSMYTFSAYTCISSTGVSIATIYGSGMASTIALASLVHNAWVVVFASAIEMFADSVLWIAPIYGPRKSVVAIDHGIETFTSGGIAFVESAHVIGILVNIVGTILCCVYASNALYASVCGTSILVVAR